MGVWGLLETALRRGRWAAPVGVVAIFSALATAPAGAAPALPTTETQDPGLTIGFAEPFHQDQETNGFLLDRSVDAGSHIARIAISWADIEPTQPEHPLDPSDPVYRFDLVDSAVRQAAERGLAVLFTIHDAPLWAARPLASQPGMTLGEPDTQHPDANALGAFATALAKRYSGTYVKQPPTGPPITLPRVSLVEPWNEPNLTGFLSPQWVGKQAYSPELYRLLLNAVYTGYKRIQPDATIIAGATAPAGDPPGGRRMAPLQFLRKLLCLKGRTKLQARPCPNPARFDVLSHHPISPERTPREAALGPDDVTISEMYKLRRMLRAAERQHTVLPAGLTRPVWATEFWWETNLPETIYDSPSERGQARSIADALRLLWEQRIPVALLFQIRDDPDVTGPPRSGWSTGVLFADNTPKLSFEAVRFPFVADRVSRRRVSVWTRSPEAGVLDINAVSKRGTQTMARIPVHPGQVVQTSFRYRGNATFVADIENDQSLPWAAPARRVTLDPTATPTRDSGDDLDG